MSLLRAERVMTGRGLVHSLRNPDGTVTAVVAPVAIMLLFVTVFGTAMEDMAGGSYVEYVTPGVMLLCAGFGAAMTATAVHADLSTGVVRRLRTMPVRASSVITGHVAASVLRNLLSTAVVLLVAVALGFRPQAGPLEWLGAAALVAGYITVLTVLAAAWGLASGGPDTAATFAFAALFPPYLSTAFVPVEGLPGFLHGVAAHQPVTPVTETLRALTSGAGPGEHAWAAVLWLTALGLAGAALTGWLFRRAVGRR